MSPEDSAPSSLYDARFEHDGCGIGFVADMHGRSSHDIVADGIRALANLAHRGAVSADGVSGDGAGILTQIPKRMFAAELDIAEDDAQIDQLAVGMMFIPASTDRAEARACIEAQIKRSQLSILGWRDVPLAMDALGQLARAECPSIEQVIIGRPDGLDDDAFERTLYLTRRRIEKAFEESGRGLIYIPSFSSRTIAYKGLVAAPQLDAFYLDLAHPDYQSAIAVFHQRYSTNTMPKWPLAQPFRYLAHNGEINTIAGNVRRFKSAEADLFSEVWGSDLAELLPVISETYSDSGALDNVFEFLVMSGRDPLHAMMMLTPMAYQQRGDLDPDLAAFYEYHSTLMSPWDGPAAVAFSDGRIAAAALDRNGLRPLRYWVTCDDRVVVGSETGLLDIPQEQCRYSGRLGPGEILAVDTHRGRLLLDDEIKFTYARRQPYRQWVEQGMLKSKPSADSDIRESDVEQVADYERLQKAFAYGAEDIERVLVPMMTDGREPIGSMGDDTPHAFLSARPKTIYRYFKQLFAQVTNPPIDPYRERLVMSRRIALGGRAGVLDESAEAAMLVKFASPIIGMGEFEWLMNLDHPRLATARLNCHFQAADGPDGLAPAVERLCDLAVEKVTGGCSLLVLSDRAVNSRWAPIPMLLASAAVHHRLIREGIRMRASIVCDTGDPRIDHHFACLLGYGAALVHPYLAWTTIARRIENGEHPGLSVNQAASNYKHSLENGLLKIMSKMGVSTMSSYRGAQLFEALGVSHDVIDRHFTGTVSRIGGVGLNQLARDVLVFHADAFGGGDQLTDRGLYRYRKNGEYHATNPTITKVLHKAVRTASREDFDQYASMVDQRPPCQIRDLLRWRSAEKPIPLNQVEPATEIVKRFCTQAMSHGAISSEAHEVLAVAMNRIGARSNSGEGGESSERFYRFETEKPQRSLALWKPKAGDWGNSAIKQIASGRFGVTPEYLVSAREIEIKMAQGSKPGEGGQILGEKVSEEIASLRRSTPGRPLISPPPHHDIYSIEDLGQLIFDMKRVNNTARVGVKLVSVAGVGTIAAGVVKAYADFVQVSGCDGGTGASPLSSIRNAGMPWELGLAEVQQTLVRNDLRGRIALRVDGGLKTGRDVLIAALLGAEEFGFGTTALVATGCVMVRQCHLNNCPVGIATQREDLREKFPGQPEHVIALMLFIAEQVRMGLAQMGIARLEDAVGRVDLLERRTGVELPKAKASDVELSAILADPDSSGERARKRICAPNPRIEIRRS